MYSMQPISVPPISELGRDALSEPMTAEDFYKSLSSKKTGIKALLLDQVETLFIYDLHLFKCY